MYLQIILIALGLAMDSVAVAIANGINSKKIKLFQSLKISFSFGFFQATMPLLGWILGIGLKNIITEVDHWVAFTLLVLIGIKMIHDVNNKKNKEKVIVLVNNKILLMQSIVTSIDAFIIGMSLAFLKLPVLTSVTIIGIITFLLSFIGVHFGKKLGVILQNKAEIFGGLILIGLGIKILLEHILS